MNRRIFIKSIFALSATVYVAKHYKDNFGDVSLPKYTVKHQVGYSMKCAISDSGGAILKQLNLENSSLEEVLFDMSLVDRYFIENKELLLFSSAE